MCVCVGGGGMRRQRSRPHRVIACPVPHIVSKPAPCLIPYLDPHGIQQDAVDEGGEADVEGHLEPLGRGERRGGGGGVVDGGVGEGVRRCVWVRGRGRGRGQTG